MNLIYEVIKPTLGSDVEVIGYVCYNTCSDLWGDEVYVGRDLKELHGAYTCSNRYHGRGLVTLRRNSEPDLEMRWCVICECLVTPPFDGYTYHDYDCEMDDSCVCDHAAEGL